MPKIYSEVYGCSANRSDYEIMLGLLKSNGFELVDSANKSDINLLVTCTVKTPTANRMIFRIKELTKTNKPLVVAGCFAKAEPEVVEKLNPNASLIGPNSIDKIVDVAYKTLSGRKSIEIDGSVEKANLPHFRTNPIIDIVEINSGCTSFCSFCETKLARGNLRSYRPDKIRDQIKKAVAEGCKEIWITSQDTSAYGRDIGTNLPELLESITRIEGEFMVRVGMMNPLHFKKVEIEDLIQVYKNEKIFKFLHLCVQSGSNKVLKDMRRGYNVEDFIYYVEKFRKEIPEITLETDIIVGFPTETEEDFEQTLKLIKKVRPDVVNISKYSPRPGTAAAKMKQLDPKIVNERSKIMYELTKKIALQNNKSKWLNWEGKVLIDEKGNRENTWMGRNYAYKPIVVESSEKLFGKFVNLKVVEVKSNYLIGNLLN
jgi:threonylcarbamoyladenosine tRNA methylthiotransferase CDKAL1